MSVQVEITIANGMARRHLQISRIADGDRLGDPHTYEAILTVLPPRNMYFAPRLRGRAEFEHQYHDDVLTLITEATAALRLEGVLQA